jgi:hypothetical protein
MTFEPDETIAVPEGQDSLVCKRCQELRCICPYLPASWGRDAHDSYRVYAMRQRDLHDQESA